MFRRGLTMRFLVMAASFVLLTVALGTGVYLLTRPGEAIEVRASLSVSDALSMDGAGFEFAMGPRRFDFPEDHGPHPEYALEWWYYTGNLLETEGSRFGYELTFFRRGLATAGKSNAAPNGPPRIYISLISRLPTSRTTNSTLLSVTAGTLSTWPERLVRRSGCG